jgi:ABC-type multidrug transport system fused ATPase/permease subunit
MAAPLMSSSQLRIRFQKLKNLVGKRTILFFCVAVALGLAWFVVETSFVYIIQIFLVVIGLVPRERTVLPADLHVTYWLAVVALIGFGLLRSIIIFFRIYISGITNQLFVRMQRIYLLTIGLHPKSIIGSAQLTTIFNENVTHAGIFLMKASESTVSLTSCFFFFVMGFYFAPYELLIALSALSLIIVPLRLLDARIRVAGTGLQDEFEKVNRTLLSTLKNKVFLDILDQTQNSISSGKQNLFRYEEHYKSFYRILSLKSVIPNFAGTVIMACVTLLSLRFLHTEPMKLVGFFYVFIRLAQSASEASGSIGDCKLHFYSLKKLYDLRIQTAQITEDANDLRSALPTCKQVRFQEVEFSYDGRSVLTRFNWQLSRGDRVLLHGPSGSGKSTLILLLCGLVRPSSGLVQYDGYSSEKFSINSLIAYSGPDPFMIEATMRENLLFGNTTGRALSDEDIIRTCQKVGVWDLISSMPGQLDYRLNESAQLSTGQRQRIALARALLQKSEILIFDEATSNIDYESEQKIFENISIDIENKIAIFISHRDSLRAFVSKEIDLSSLQRERS